MNAVEYLKEKTRMTQRCKIKCQECSLNPCDDNERYHPEQAVEIVEQWAKEHPRKTYLSMLLEKFPKAKLLKNGTPKICPSDVFGIEGWEKCKFPQKCEECWNREYKEEE